MPANVDILKEEKGRGWDETRHVRIYKFVVCVRVEVDIKLERARKGGENVPLDLPDSLFVAPLFPQLASILHRLSFSRIDRSQFGRGVRLPDPIRYRKKRMHVQLELELVKEG